MVDAGEIRWTSTPATVADVQAWLDHPDENYGWLLMGGENTPTTSKRFASREAADPAEQPQLLVEYEAPCAAIALEGETRALCEAYCEALDCDAPAHAASPRACEQIAWRFAERTGGADLPCERSGLDGF